MGSKINEQIRTYYYYGATGAANLAYIIYDEAGVSFGTGNMSEIGATGLYYCDWTPDTAGVWVWTVSRASQALDGRAYHVDMGQEEDIIDRQREILDVIVYITAEDSATTEGTDDGSSPLLLSEVSKTNASEAASLSDPAWSEDINFEQEGTITTISIYYNFQWQMKITGAGTGYCKWQISGDGGSTWVDVTDNVSETGTSYTDKQRMLSGRHITAVSVGANKLQFRLCSWTDATSVETKVRSDSYVRICYRKA